MMPRNTTVRTIVDQGDGRDCTSIKHLEHIDPERKLEASWRARQRSRDALPKRIADTLTKGRELLKEAGAQTTKLIHHHRAVARSGAALAAAEAARSRRFPAHTATRRREASGTVVVQNRRTMPNQNSKNKLNLYTSRKTNLPAGGISGPAFANATKRIYSACVVLCVWASGSRGHLVSDCLPSPGAQEAIPTPPARGAESAAAAIACAAGRRPGFARRFGGDGANRHRHSTIGYLSPVEFERKVGLA